MNEMKFQLVNCSDLSQVDLPGDGFHGPLCPTHLSELFYRCLQEGDDERPSFSVIQRLLAEVTITLTSMVSFSDDRTGSHVQCFLSSVSRQIGTSFCCCRFAKERKVFFNRSEREVGARSEGEILPRSSWTIFSHDTVKMF